MHISNQTALVVGATGFIGKFLIARLLSNNAQVFALCRNVDQQAPQLRHWLTHQGIAHQQLNFIQGDVTLPNLGLSKQDWQQLKAVHYLYNTSALFAWNLTMQQAKEVNVNGLELLLESVSKHCQLERAVHLSGYMLTLNEHLQAAGIYRDRIEHTDWSQVYARLGAYEASKIQGHFTWVKQAIQYNIPWTVIHPATVIGDETTGEIPSYQPIAHLIQQLKQGKMTAIPGTAQHYLPLVSVTMLVDAIIHAAQDPNTLQQEILVANPEQVSFQELIQLISQQLHLKPPRHFISLKLLKQVLKWRWLAHKLDMSAEMLNFIRTEPLDLERFITLNQQWNIPNTDIESKVKKTVIWASQLKS